MFRNNSQAHSDCIRDRVNNRLCKGRSDRRTVVDPSVWTIWTISFDCAKTLWAVHVRASVVCRSNLIALVRIATLVCSEFPGMVGINVVVGRVGCSACGVVFRSFAPASEQHRHRGNTTH